MKNLEKQRPSYYDTPQYQHGGNFFINTPEGEIEELQRDLISRTLVPGETVIIDFAFSEPQQGLTNGLEATFMGWMEAELGAHDEELAYSGTEPGVYIYYGRVRISVAGQEYNLNSNQITLPNQEDILPRIKKLGPGPLPKGPQRIKDSPKH